MTGSTYDGFLGLRVVGSRWERTMRPPLSLSVLEQPDHLLVMPSDQSGGLRGGDRVATEVVLHQAAWVEWRPPTCGLYFPDAERERSCQVSVRLELDACSRLAWLPPVAIPCKQAKVEQTVELVGQPGAELLYWDAWADGRTGSGERGAFDRLANRLEVRWGGRTVFRERWTLNGVRPGGEGDPAGLQNACQWHLGIASGAESVARLVHMVRSWQNLGEVAEWGEVDDQLVVARVLSRRAWSAPASAN